MTHINKLFSNLSKHTIKTNIIGLVHSTYFRFQILHSANKHGGHYELEIGV